MSLAAHRYVRNLKQAPRTCLCPGAIHGGYKITIQERAILWILADHHNEKARGAWPSIPTIAKYNGIGDRRAQQIIAALGCRGILRITARVRENGSKQSNFYSFPAIDGADCPAEVLGAAPDDERGDTYTRASMHHPGATNYTSRCSDLHHLNLNRTQNETAGEKLVETAKEKAPLPPKDVVGALLQIPERVQTDVGPQELWSVVKVQLKEQLSSTFIATDLPYEYDKYFRDSWQKRIQGQVITLVGKHPESLRDGVRRYKKRINTIIRQLVGIEATIVVPD